MQSINDYSEYLAALKDKSSKDPVICAEKQTLTTRRNIV